MYKFGLIGFPVKHSLSPWIHEQFLNLSNLKGSYSLFEISPEQSFSEAIKQLKEKSLTGFNITVPYKQKIMTYLDEIDEEAKQIGAVNTVLSKDGSWIGYNTDGKGYLRSLEYYYPNIFSHKANKVLLLGAGGAARGIYHALLDAGFSNIDIANRTKASAVEISKLNNGKTHTNVITLQQAEEMLNTYHLVIQTSSVGMNPNSECSIISLENLQTNTIVSDIVYQPIETKILRDAKQIGAEVHYGHTMLLYQAQYAFEIWTGKRVPIENMDEQLSLILKGS